MQLTGYGYSYPAYSSFYENDDDDDQRKFSEFLLDVLSNPEPSNSSSVSAKKAPSEDGDLQPLKDQENRSLTKRCSIAANDSLSSLIRTEESRSNSSSRDTRPSPFEPEKIDSENKEYLGSINENRAQAFEWLHEQGGATNTKALEIVRVQLGLTIDTTRDYYYKFKNNKLKPMQRDPYNVCKKESAPHPIRSATNDEFSDSEDFLEDSDKISSQDSLENISNAFRTKIFKILQSAGGLHNEKAREAAIKATGYKPDSFDSFFKKSLKGKLPPMKRKLYRFTENEPETLAHEFNKRIRYLKKESFPSSVPHSSTKPYLKTRCETRTEEDFDPLS